MGYRGQSGSRRGSGERFQKSPHEKAKHKIQKPKSGIKFAQEEEPVPSLGEVSEKILGSLSRLGNQTFALSPFSHYFDDWLISLRQMVSEFESNPSTNVDEEFQKERMQIFADVESQFAQIRLKEAELEASANALAQNNHLLVETDADYATQTRELGKKRNGEIGPLTQKVHELEHELSSVEQVKASFLNPFAKRAKAQKQTEATQKLKAAKTELEIAMQNFKVEQDKLHDDYEKKKEMIMEKVRGLEKEIVNIESDASLQVRQSACAALAATMKGFLNRRSASSQAQP